MSPILGASMTLSDLFDYKNITLTTALPKQERMPIMSNHVISHINVYLYFLFGGSIALFGTVNNIVNMAIFHRLGLRDSMSIGLMTLSLTDFLVCLFGLVRIFSFLWDVYFMSGHPIRLLAINEVSMGWLMDSFFLCSGWITTFLSVERCICVVLPFKVKDIFTKRRTLIILIIIYVINFGVKVPVFFCARLGWRTMEVDMNHNGTVLREHMFAWFTDIWPQVQLFVDVADGSVLPIPSQALVFISIIWMSYGLQASSKIRNLNALSQDSNKSQMSYKERRLLKLVLSLAILLIFCNIPRFIAVYAKQIFPEVDYANTDENLYTMLWTLVNISSVINASGNIFLYLVVNVSYRKKFQEMFCRFKEQQ